MSDDAFKSRERTRLCPSCRMSISVLATKCRFCGENVGRPKDETRNLSIQDLGGETIVHYAPSSNVMEALEAFRSDETSTKTPEPKKRTTIFGRKGAETATTAKSQSGLPELDERSKALASLTMPTPRASTTYHAQKPTWMKKMAFMGAFVAVLVILYLGSSPVKAMIMSFMSPDDGPAYNNQALAIIENGGDPVEALREASTAIKHENSVANKEIMEQAQKYFTAKVQDILNSPRVSLRDLRTASNLATAGWQAAPSQSMQALRDEADKESMAYGMHVVSIDTKSTPRKAVLQLIDKKQVELKQDDTFWNGRFRVQSITDDFVRIIDNERTTPTGTKRQVLVNSGGIPK